MKKLVKQLEFELRNKLCTMCQHYVQIAPISEKPVGVCTKLGKVNSLIETKKKGTYYYQTACQGEEYITGGEKFRAFAKCRTNL